MRIEGQGSNYDDALFTNYKDILNLLMFRRNSIITAGLPDMDKLNGVLEGISGLKSDLLLTIKFWFYIIMLEYYNGVNL